MRPVKILIAEDKIVIAETIAAVLEKAGYSISARVASGEDALAQIERDMPDVILMDIELAGELDGVQTVEEINNLYNIPVIYLTDFGDETTFTRAKATHPAAYLMKPFHENDLLRAIEIAFHNASTGKEALPRDEKEKIDDIFPLSDRFFIKFRDGMYRIDITDILWIKADRSYFEIRTVNDTFKLVGNLNNFNKRLNHPLLIRVHRSYIANMDKITAIKGNKIVIDNNEIPTGEEFREKLNKRLQMI
jgi:DNA-binding LytR/AlgR family response regulator